MCLWIPLDHGLPRAGLCLTRLCIRRALRILCYFSRTENQVSPLCNGHSLPAVPLCLFSLLTSCHRLLCIFRTSWPLSGYSVMLSSFLLRAFALAVDSSRSALASVHSCHSAYMQTPVRGLPPPPYLRLPFLCLPTSPLCPIVLIYLLQSIFTTCNRIMYLLFISRLSPSFVKGSLVLVIVISAVVPLAK